MAKNLTGPQRTLLRAPELKARLLSTWYMDDGTYRYCDDPYDMVYFDGVSDITWIGASALASATDIRMSGTGFAAEPVTITIDGTRMSQIGFSDPAAFFQLILQLPLTNRRVDLAYGLSYPDSEKIGMIMPVYAGKINAPRLLDPRLNDLGSADSQPQTKLEITLDSLALRYQWATGRTRSHEDQLEIDSTDMFFSYVQNSLRKQATLYWGKATPAGAGGWQPVFNYNSTNFSVNLR